MFAMFADTWQIYVATFCTKASLKKCYEREALLQEGCAKCHNGVLSGI